MEKENKIKTIDVPVISRTSEFVRYEFDEALELLGFGKFHWILLIVNGLCLMAFITESLNIGFVVPMAECDLQLTMSDKGMLNGAAFFGILLSSYFWGFFADTWGRRKSLFISTSMTFLWSSLSSISVNVWMLVITKFLVGIFVSACASNSFAYLGEFNSEKTRSQSLSFAGTFIGISFIFCPGIAWIIAHLPAISFEFCDTIIEIPYWRIFLFISACMSGVTALSLYFLPESPKFLLAQGNFEDAINVLKKVYKWNTGDHPDNYPVRNVWLNENIGASNKNENYFKLMFHQTILLFKKPLLRATLFTGFINFALVASSSGFYLWVPNLLNNMLKFDSYNVSICGAAQQIVLNQVRSTTACVDTVNPTVFVIIFILGVYLSLGYIFNGLIVNKCGNQKLLAIIFSVSMICGVLLPFAHNFYIIVFLIYQFMVTGISGSLISAIIVDMFPTNVRGMALCLILFIGRFGAIAGSNAVAYLMLDHCVLMFVIFGIINCLNAIAVLILK